MPRVVPSQVIAFIDNAFPGAARNTLGRGNSGQLSGLVQLIDQIPDDLLTMDNPTYASFVVANAHIKERLSTWTAQLDRAHDLGFIPANPPLNPVTVIREALAGCPDQSPAPSTSELQFITDPDLRINLRYDIGAINRALSNGEWKAATVLAGSAVEALLLWDIQNRHAADIPGAVAALVGNDTFRQRPPTNPEDWSLHHYIEVAACLQTIRPETVTETRLAKDFRNLIHPGRSQRLAQKCDRGTALSCVAALEHVVRDLS